MRTDLNPKPKGIDDPDRCLSGNAREPGAAALAAQQGTLQKNGEAEKMAHQVAGKHAVVKPPMGEARSDSEIARAVDTAFHWHDSVPADRIKVHVKEGWVTLNGEVDWEYQRAAAVNLARPLAGVVGISNCVVLNPAQRRRAAETAFVTCSAAGPETRLEQLHEQAGQVPDANHFYATQEFIPLVPRMHTPLITLNDGPVGPA